MPQILQIELVFTHVIQIKQKKKRKKKKTAFKLAWVNEQTKLVIYTHLRIELTGINASNSIVHVRQGLSEAFTTRISHLMF